MNSYKKIVKELEKIKSENFDYERVLLIPGIEINASVLLRKVLLLYNDIKFSVKDGEKNELIEMLDDIMKNKFLDLNPNLDDEMLNQILASLKRSNVIFPLDFFVISNAVITKEMILDNDSPYEIRTFMLSNNGKYFNILDNIYFTLRPDFDTPDAELDYIKDESKVANIINNNINYILKFVCDDIKINQYYEFNNPKFKISPNGKDINIYLNKCLYELVFSIKEKRDIDIELILQEGDIIFLYNIKQKIEKEEITWTISESTAPIWILSESAMDKENSKVKKITKN